MMYSMTLHRHAARFVRTMQIAAIGLLVTIALSVHAVGTVLPAPDLPKLVFAPETEADAPLPGLLREALRGYATRLPDVTALQWLDLDHDTAGQLTRTQRYWNEPMQAFGAACRREPSVCEPLVAAQLQAMDRALRADAHSGASLTKAVTLSVMSDLCQYRTGLPECPLNQHLPSTAVQWMLLGRDLLFVEWVQRYNAQRTQYLSWVKSQGQQLGASTLAALPPLPHWLQAEYFERVGQLSAAREAWLQALVEAVTSRSAADSERMAALRLARLSWRLSDEEAALQWQQYVAALPEPAAPPCWQRSEQWRIDIARAYVLRQPLPDAPGTLRELIAAECPYTQALADYAVDVLTGGAGSAASRSSDAASTADMLTVGVQACHANCAPGRRQALRGLLLLAQSESREIAKLGVTWRGRLDRFENLLESDKREAWATAAALLREPTLKEQGLALLTALQGHILIGHEADRFNSTGAQQNRSRWDALHRTAALAATQQGQTLELQRLEAMRAQTLLRRLRLTSLERELATVRDADAQARYESTVSALQQAWRQLDGLSGRDDARLSALRLQLRRMNEDTIADAKLDLLEALAAQRLDGADPEKAWLRTMRGSAIDELQRVDTPAGAPDALTSLGADTAYLSWLEVPGGYVASVAWHDAAWPTRHRQINRFIAVSAAQAASFQLYRELLMSGADVTRGVRRLPVPLSDREGISLRGVPVWRAADGSFVSQPAAPSGGQRVRSLQEIGESLYSLLLEPLKPQWGGARKLLLSPDGPLTQLPFETLWAGKQLLLEVIEVSYVQSLQVHAELIRRAQAPRAQGNQLLSIANPDYGAAPAASQPVPDWMASLRWQPLDGTRVEAEALRPLFPKARQLTGADATRKQVLALQTSSALQDFRVIHFATHGYVDGQRSALVLSTREGLQQAYLLDADISGLQLRSDLVLLSACDTGLGRRQTGEGVVGLPYAFMLAGNINTLMSLWPVDDSGTAAFIPAFMAKARSGMNVVAALNATKRDFAAGLHGARNRDPRIWAAFVQYGVPLTLQ